MVRNAWKVQKRILKSNDNETRMLRDIFVNLKDLDIIITVRPTDDWRDPNGAGNLLRKALGRGAVKTMGGPFDTDYLVKGSCRRYVRIVLEALIMAEYPIQRLDLACPYDNTGLKRTSFNFRESVISRCGTAFATLTHLKIKLDPKLFVKHPDRFANLALCFGQLPQLRSFGIAVAYDEGRTDREGYFTPMLDCFDLRRIQTLTLHGAYARAGDYISMLDRANPALENFEMCGCDIIGSGCWSDVFRWAQDQMGSLSLLQVLDVGHVETGVYEYGDVDSRPVCWDGLDEVSQGLRMLSDRPRYKPHERE